MQQSLPTATYQVISSWWIKAEMSMSEISPWQVDGSIKNKLQSQPLQVLAVTNLANKLNKSYC